MNTKNILLTGGHAGSTAFALIEEIRREDKKWDLIWVGSKSSIEGKNVPSLSSLFFPKYNVKVYNIISGRLQRKFTFWTIPSFFKIPIGFFHAFVILLKTKPDAILAFGGFSSFPIVICGRILRIPIIIHEQTAAVGRANRLSSVFADRVAISRNSSRSYFPQRKVVFTGNPIQKEFIEMRPSKKLSEPVTILITGGQSGSVTINSNIEKILPRLLKDFKVIHQTGIAQEDKFKGIRENLDSLTRKNYKVFGILDPKIWPSVLKDADFIISRAGANITSQIIAAKKPAILIPLPFAYLDEQLKNAQNAQEFGVARIIEQQNLTPELLLKFIYKTRDEWNSIMNKIRAKKSPDFLAAKKLAGIIEESIV